MKAMSNGRAGDECGRRRPAPPWTERRSPALSMFVLDRAERRRRVLDERRVRGAPAQRFDPERARAREQVEHPRVAQHAHALTADCPRFAHAIRRRPHVEPRGRDESPSSRSSRHDSHERHACRNAVRHRHGVVAGTDRVLSRPSPRARSTTARPNMLHGGIAALLLDEMHGRARPRRRQDPHRSPARST